MSAERLREAARVLRERAEGATEGPWAYGEEWAAISSGPDSVIHAYYVGRCDACSDKIEDDADVGAISGDDATYIATMHPGVGLALADWLDTAGADLWAHGPLCECGSGCTVCDDDVWQPHVRRALAVAALILGGAS